MLNKGYDPATLRAMSLAGNQARETAMGFHVDGVWWLVDYWIHIDNQKPRMRLMDVWVNGRWADAQEVLSKPLQEALSELLSNAVFDNSDEASNAQA